MLASPSVTVVLASASNSDVQDSDGIVLASTSVVLASAGVEWCSIGSTIHYKKLDAHSYH